MAADPRTMRASDDDRDRVAALLREHHAVGRLTPEEFSERLDKAFQAKTMGDLDDLLADLPGIDLYRLPDASVRRGHPRPGASSHFEAVAAAGGAVSRHRMWPAWQAAFGSWFTCTLLCFVIWALSGAGYLWPLWVAGPWGAIVLCGLLTGGSHHDRHHDHRRHHQQGQVDGGDQDQIGGSGGTRGTRDTRDTRDTPGG
jgi:Domain of unknown function (DUF1707)